jgi:hypothetical protein
METPYLLKFAEGTDKKLRKSRLTMIYDPVSR